MAWLSGYRTIIAIVVSMILKILVAKGIIAGDVDAGDLTDKILLVVSGIADLFAIFFRMKATKPGALANP